MYSHDAFGLGQLRRWRAIAHALVARHVGLNVLILTGSPIIGRFRFRPRVDFVRLPGIVRLRTGEYASLSLDCEGLSLGRPCLVVPPDAARGGPLVGAEAARKPGLVQMRHFDQLGPEALADTLAQLPVQPPPATDRTPGLLGGLQHITTAVGRWRTEGPPP